MKILHAPTNTANQGWLLSRGQRDLGHEAIVHSLGTGYLQYSVDKTLQFHSGERKRDLAFIFHNLAECIESDYDVYHFYYHASLLPKSYGLVPYMDVDVLRRMGKKVFFHFMGCDFRLPYLSYKRNPHSMCVDCRACLERDKLSQLERILELASGIFVAGVQGQPYVGDAKFHTLPIAVDVSALNMGAPQRPVPFVVHMPTNRDIKGTRFVLSAVETLHKEGLAFEFELIEKSAHTEALEKLRNADILVDQTGNDFYGTVATEAMAMGRVVLTGTAEEALAQYGTAAPIVPISPLNLTEKLRTTIQDLQLREELSRQGPKYVERYHSHIVVARESLRAYESPRNPLSAAKSSAAVVNPLRSEMLAAQPAFDATQAGQTASIQTTPSNEMSIPPDQFEFPLERRVNPRLDEPLHVRFGHGLPEYTEDKYLYGRKFYYDELDKLELSLRGTLLDVGCGPGQWALSVAELSPELTVVGADRNDYLIQCARAQIKKLSLANCTAVRCDIYRLPFPDEFFDNTMCIGVLQLVRTDDAFAELVRVTKPGGNLLINVSGAGFYVRNTVNAMLGGHRKIAEQNWRFLRNTLARAKNKPFVAFTASRIRTLGRAHGLEVEYIRPTGLYPPQRPTFFSLPVNHYALLRKV